jgi:predicted dehydrogenase
MTSKKYNVGVIGYGLSAKVFHIPLVEITPSFTLSAIMQRTPTTSNDASKDHPSAKLYHTSEELIADPSIDVIIVTTPPSTHFSLAKASLEAGKHVLVEKPFVPTSDEALKLVDLSRAVGKQLCVYQNRRWDSDFLTLRKLINDGTLGQVVEFSTHFDRYKPVRPETWKGELSMSQGGGVVYDLGTHLIDQAYTLFGLPKTVFANFANQRGDAGEEGVEPDSITILLNYGPNGPLVTVKAGVMSIEKEQLRYWVRGTKGSWKKYHLDVQEDQLKAGLKPGDEGFGIEGKERAGKLVVLDDKGQAKESAYENIVPETYSKLYEGFAKAIESGKEEDVPVKATEAAEVLRIIAAARESAHTGQAVNLIDYSSSRS